MVLRSYISIICKGEGQILCLLKESLVYDLVDVECYVCVKEKVNGAIVWLLYQRI